MSIEIFMPALSPTMKKGHLVAWHKHEGDTVEVGDLLAEIETDKATMEVEAVDDGVMGAILVAAGTKDVAVGTPIAVLLEEGEEASSISAPSPSKEAAANTPVNHAPANHDETSLPLAPESVEGVETFDVPDMVPHPDNDDRGGVRISPLARKLARDHGVDTRALKGSGPRGRIVKADIEHALAGGDSALHTAGSASAQALQSSVSTTPLPSSTPAPASSEGLFSGYEPAFEAMPVSGMREVIAQRLWQSKYEIPHFYVTREVDMGGVTALRQKLKARDIKLSVNDFVLKATAHALQAFPLVNSAWAQDTIRVYQTVDLAVAVSVAEGLITPVIRDAASKGLKALSAEMKDLATRAREGKLTPQEFQGGTFTVSSLGMFGIDAFSAIVNPPQAGILAVSALKEVPVAVDGRVTVAPRMALTLSVDHRVVDGVLAAHFLNQIKLFLEDPAAMLL